MIVGLMEAAKSFILCMASDQTGLLIFTKKKKRPKIHALLPTSSNLFVHVLSDQLLVMLWNICDGILFLQYSALTQLSDGSNCQCRAQEKMQQSWMRHITCSSYCSYSGEDRCCNQKRFRRVSRCSILRRDVNVMRMVLLILIKCV